MDTCRNNNDSLFQLYLVVVIVVVRLWRASLRRKMCWSTELSWLERTCRESHARRVWGSITIGLTLRTIIDANELCCWQGHPPHFLIHCIELMRRQIDDLHRSLSLSTRRERKTEPWEHHWFDCLSSSVVCRAGKRVDQIEKWTSK